MDHHFSLITTIAAALGFGLLFGMAAVRLRLPALVGYLAAGIMIGPATPGFVADVALASQLAEIGVMLLMFGVGLHFSIDDLMEVRGIALPGAVLQIAVATLLGMGLAHLWGWPLGAGLVFFFSGLRFGWYGQDIFLLRLGIQLLSGVLLGGLLARVIVDALARTGAV
ncbi:MAG: cation:proton antiporter, partial [Gammaproteobacteria bacterium]